MTWSPTRTSLSRTWRQRRICRIGFAFAFAVAVEYGGFVVEGVERVEVMRGAFVRGSM